MTAPNLEFITKCLIPKKEDGIIPRRRLLDLLHNQIGLRAQILSSPAGYGKTTLLVDFATELETPVCWYSLDDTDKDPEVLVEGILSSIRSHFPEFGRSTQSRLITSKDIAKEAAQIIGVLTGEMHTAVPDYFVLVLEDFHFIEDSSAAKALLNLLLERAPDNCHILISSRTPVELPALSKLYLQNLAANINTAQIAFTPPEVKDFLAKRHGLTLTDEEASTLAAKTEGWMIGILLSTYSLRARTTPADSFALSHEKVFRYLTSEIYDRQPLDIQEFLLASSTLDTIEPEICSRLTGISNSRQLLQDIEKKNLFIQCINYDKACYRYHLLFREFLQRKLLEEDPERFTSLHCTAALIFEQEKRWHEAITHFMTARKHDEALRVIKAIGMDFQKAGKWATVNQWIEALPEAIRRSDPDLLLLQSQSLVYLGENDKAIHLLTDLLSRTSGAKDWLLQAKAFSWRSAAFRLAGHFAEAKGDIETAIRLLEQHDGPVDTMGDAYRRLGNIHLEQGQLQLALKSLKSALKHFASLFDVAQMSDVHNSLGIVYKRMGNLDQATTHFEHARQGWLKEKNSGALAMTLNNIGYIYQRRGQYDMALQTLNLGLDKARQTNYHRIEACLLIAMAEVLRDMERYDDALDSYNKGLELAREVMESYYVIWAKAGIGETYRLLGEQDKAEVLIREAIPQAIEQGQHYEAAVFSMQLGIIEYERGQYENALRILNDVCSRLATIGDKDALAKAYFHLAQAAFLDKRYDLALDWLGKTSDLADKLGYDDFMAVEGRKALLLMEYGISKSIGGNRFIRIVEKLRKRRISQTVTPTTHTGNTPDLVQKPDIEVRTLGETAVLLDARHITEAQWRSLRAKEIFFFLLCSSTGQTKEEITAAVWPDLSQAKSTSNFHINLYRLRRALYPNILTLEQGRYRINPDLDVRFDVAEFERAIKEADSSQSDKQMLSKLERAIELYKGPFLTEIYSEWAESRRQELENKYLKALLLSARLNSDYSHHPRSIELLEKYISVDPYQDEVYCLLIEQYLTLGEEISASKTYKRYIETASHELNCLPSARMRDLHRRILIGKKTSPK